MQVLGIWVSFIIILITYIIASIISIYHIIKFGINKKTAIISSIIYFIASFLIIFLIVIKLIQATLFINNL